MTALGLIRHYARQDYEAITATWNGAPDVAGLIAGGHHLATELAAALGEDTDVVLNDLIRVLVATDDPEEP